MIGTHYHAAVLASRDGPSSSPARGASRICTTVSYTTRRLSISTTLEMLLCTRRHLQAARALCDEGEKERETYARSDTRRRYDSQTQRPSKQICDRIASIT